LLISPTEPNELKALGKLSLLTEAHGADVLIVPHSSWGGMLGVQRKEVKDLIASLGDGRFGEQMLKLKDCKQGLLLIEGRVRWSEEGELLNVERGQKISRGSWWAMMWSVRLAGHWVDHTDNVRSTCEYLKALETWAQKEHHRSLHTRPNPTGKWGVATNRDWQRHLVMSLPGIGPELAERILDEVGQPLGLRVGVEELLQVRGLGRKRLDRINRALGQEEGEVT